MISSLDIMPNPVEPTKAQRLEYTSSASFRKRPRRPGGSRRKPTTPTPPRRPGSRPATPPTPATETDFLYDSGKSYRWCSGLKSEKSVNLGEVALFASKAKINVFQKYFRTDRPS